MRAGLKRLAVCGLCAALAAASAPPDAAAAIVRSGAPRSAPSGRAASMRVLGLPTRFQRLNGGVPPRAVATLGTEASVAASRSAAALIPSALPAAAAASEKKEAALPASAAAKAVEGEILAPLSRAVDALQDGGKPSARRAKADAGAALGTLFDASTQKEARRARLPVAFSWTEAGRAVKLTTHARGRSAEVEVRIPAATASSPAPPRFEVWMMGSIAALVTPVFVFLEPAATGFLTSAGALLAAFGAPLLAFFKLDELYKKGVRQPLARADARSLARLTGDSRAWSRRGLERLDAIRALGKRDASEADLLVLEILALNERDDKNSAEAMLALARVGRKAARETIARLLADPEEARVRLNERVAAAAPLQTEQRGWWSRLLRFARRAPRPAALQDRAVDSFSRFLEAKRAGLPAAAASRLDAIAAELPWLEPRLSAVNPESGEARRLLERHLPDLIKYYERIPPPLRGKLDNERLLHSLDLALGQLKHLNERLAAAERQAFETQGRFMESRYGDSDMAPASEPLALPAPEAQVPLELSRERRGSRVER